MEAVFIAKWAHIISSSILFGAGIGTAFQMVWAMHTRRTETIHSVASGVVIADWLFTTPTLLIQPATGIWLVWLMGYSLTEPWLIASYVLYALAFCCWVPVAKLQIRIRDLAARAHADNAPLPDAVYAAYRTWFILGWPALLAFLGIYWLMVARPYW